MRIVGFKAPAQVACAVIFSLGLAACGGGGGGESPGGGVVTPPPPPPPTLSKWTDKLKAGAAFVVAGKGQDVAYTASLFSVNSVDPASAVGDASVSYTLGSASELTGLKITSGARSIAFAAADGDTFTAPASGSPLSVALSKDASRTAVSSDPTKLGWNYQSFTVWQTGILQPAVGFPTGSGATGAVSVGETTTAAYIPTAGSAVFRGRAVGTYLHPTSAPRILEALATLNVNFAARSVFFTTSGFSPVNGQNIGGGAGLIGTLTYSAGANALTGAVNTADGRLTGSASAQFYGPNAEEAGGVFFLSGVEPAMQATERFIGAFGAAQSGAVAPGAFSAWSANRTPGATVTVSGQSQEMTFTREGFLITALSDPSAVRDAVMTDVYDAGGALTSRQVAAQSRTVAFSKAAGDTLSRLGSFNFTSADGNAGALVSDATILGMDYQSFGVWETGVNTGAGSLGVFSVGAATPGATVPTTGAATFKGQAHNAWARGGGVNVIAQTMSLTADFAARTADLTVDPLTLPLGGGSSIRFEGVNGRLTYAAGANLMTGAVTTTDGLMSGVANARFFGPGAEEVGGFYSLKPTSGAPSTSGLVGAFGAKR